MSNNLKDDALVSAQYAKWEDIRRLLPTKNTLSKLHRAKRGDLEEVVTEAILQHDLLLAKVREQNKVILDHEAEAKTFKRDKEQSLADAYDNQEILAREVEVLTSRLDELRKKKEAEIAKLTNDLSSEIRSLGDEVDRLRSENKWLQREVTELENQLSQFNGNENKQSTVELQLSKLRQDNIDLAKELRRVQGAAKENEKAYRDIQLEKKLAYQERDEARAAAEKIKQSLSTDLRDLEEVVAQTLSEKEDEVNTLKAESAFKDNQVSRLEQKIKELAADVDKKEELLKKGAKRQAGNSDNADNAPSTNIGMSSALSSAEVSKLQAELEAVNCQVDVWKERYSVGIRESDVEIRDLKLLVSKLERELEVATLKGEMVDELEQAVLELTKEKEDIIQEREFELNEVRAKERVEKSKLVQMIRDEFKIQEESYCNEIEELRAYRDGLADREKAYHDEIKELSDEVEDYLSQLDQLKGQLMEQGKSINIVSSLTATPTGTSPATGGSKTNVDVEYYESEIKKLHKIIIDNTKEYEQSLESTKRNIFIQANNEKEIAVKNIIESCQKKVSNADEEVLTMRTDRDGMVAMMESAVQAKAKVEAIQTEWELEIKEVYTLLDSKCLIISDLESEIFTLNNKVSQLMMMQSEMTSAAQLHTIIDSLHEEHSAKVQSLNEDYSLKINNLNIIIARKNEEITRIVQENEANESELREELEALVVEWEEEEEKNKNKIKYLTELLGSNEGVDIDAILVSAGLNNSEDVINVDTNVNIDEQSIRKALALEVIISKKEIKRLELELSKVVDEWEADVERMTKMGLRYGVNDNDPPLSSVNDTDDHTNLKSLGLPITIGQSYNNDEESLLSNSYYQDSIKNNDVMAAAEFRAARAVAIQLQLEKEKNILIKTVEDLTELCKNNKISITENDKNGESTFQEHGVTESKEMASPPSVSCNYHLKTITNLKIEVDKLTDTLLMLIGQQPVNVEIISNRTKGDELHLDSVLSAGVTTSNVIYNERLWKLILLKNNEIITLKKHVMRNDFEEWHALMMRRYEDHAVSVTDDIPVSEITPENPSANMNSNDESDNYACDITRDPPSDTPDNEDNLPPVSSASALQEPSSTSKVVSPLNKVKELVTTFEMKSKQVKLNLKNNDIGNVDSNSNAIIEHSVSSKPTTMMYDMYINNFLTSGIHYISPIILRDVIQQVMSDMNGNYQNVQADVNNESIQNLLSNSSSTTKSVMAMPYPGQSSLTGLPISSSSHSFSSSLLTSLSSSISSIINVVPTMVNTSSDGNPVYSVDEWLQYFGQAEHLIRRLSSDLTSLCRQYSLLEQQLHANATTSSVQGKAVATSLESASTSAKEMVDDILCGVTPSIPSSDAHLYQLESKLLQVENELESCYKEMMLAAGLDFRSDDEEIVMSDEEGQGVVDDCAHQPPSSTPLNTSNDVVQHDDRDIKNTGVVDDVSSSPVPPPTVSPSYTHVTKLIHNLKCNRNQTRMLQTKVKDLEVLNKELKLQWIAMDEEKCRMESDLGILILLLEKQRYAMTMSVRQPLTRAADAEKDVSSTWFPQTMNPSFNTLGMQDELSLHSNLSDSSANDVKTIKLKSKLLSDIENVALLKRSHSKSNVLSDQLKEKNNIIQSLQHEMYNLKQRYALREEEVARVMQQYDEEIAEWSVEAERMQLDIDEKDDIITKQTNKLQLLLENKINASQAITSSMSSPSSSTSAIEVELMNLLKNKDKHINELMVQVANAEAVADQRNFTLKIDKDDLLKKIHVLETEKAIKIKQTNDIILGYEKDLKDLTEKFSVKGSQYNSLSHQNSCLLEELRLEKYKNSNNSTKFNNSLYNNDETMQLKSSNVSPTKPSSSAFSLLDPGTHHLIQATLKDYDDEVYHLSLDNTMLAEEITYYEEQLSKSKTVEKILLKSLKSFENDLNVLKRFVLQLNTKYNEKNKEYGTVVLELKSLKKQIAAGMMDPSSYNSLTIQDKENNHIYSKDSRDGSWTSREKGSLSSDISLSDRDVEQQYQQQLYKAQMEIDGLKLALNDLVTQNQNLTKLQTYYQASIPSSTLTAVPSSTSSTSSSAPAFILPSPSTSVDIATTLRFARAKKSITDNNQTSNSSLAVRNAHSRILPPLDQSSSSDDDAPLASAGARPIDGLHSNESSTVAQSITKDKINRNNTNNMDESRLEVMTTTTEEFTEAMTDGVSETFTEELSVTAEDWELSDESSLSDDDISDDEDDDDDDDNEDDDVDDNSQSQSKHSPAKASSISTAMVSLVSSGASSIIHHPSSIVKPSPDVVSDDDSEDVSIDMSDDDDDSL